MSHRIINKRFWPGKLWRWLTNCPLKIYEGTGRIFSDLGGGESPVSFTVEAYSEYEATVMAWQYFGWINGMKLKELVP